MSLKPYEITGYKHEVIQGLSAAYYHHDELVDFYDDTVSMLEELKQEISACYSLTLEEEPDIDELNQRLFNILCDFDGKAIVKP